MQILWLAPQYSLFLITIVLPPLAIVHSNKVSPYQINLRSAISEKNYSQHHKMAKLLLLHSKIQKKGASPRTQKADYLQIIVIKKLNKCIMP